MKTTDFFYKGAGTTCKPLIHGIPEFMLLQSKSCVRTKGKTRNIAVSTEDHFIFNMYVGCLLFCFF